MTERRLPDGDPVGPGLDAHGWPLPPGRTDEWEADQLARLLDITAGLANLVELITNPQKAATFLTAQKALTEALERVREGQATATAEEHSPVPLDRPCGCSARFPWHALGCPTLAPSARAERCEHCDAPFTPGAPGRLNQDMTRWRHMACPACWICKRPLDDPAGPMGLLPAEWVEMADSRAGMAHTACFEGIREDL